MVLAIVIAIAIAMTMVMSVVMMNVLMCGGGGGGGGGLCDLGVGWGLHEFLEIHNGRTALIAPLPLAGRCPLVLCGCGRGCGPRLAARMTRRAMSRRLSTLVRSRNPPAGSRTQSSNVRCANPSAPPTAEEIAEEMIYIADLQQNQSITFTEFRQVVVNWD